MVRVLGHRFKPENFQNSYTFWTGQQEELFALRAKARKEKNDNLFHGIFENGLKVFRMGYLLGDPLADLFRKANKAVPELIPGLEMGHSFGPEDLREALGFSLTLRQAKVSAWLTKLPREGYTQNTVETSEINFLLAEAMQEGAKKNRKSFVASVKKLRPALAPKRLIVSPRVESALFRPEVELFESVASGDSARLAEAWKAKGDAWKKAYAKASEQRNADAILDVVALGVARIGEGFGMKVPPTHPYAPLELLT